MSTIVDSLFIDTRKKYGTDETGVEGILPQRVHTDDGNLWEYGGLFDMRGSQERLRVLAGINE